MIKVMLVDDHQVVRSGLKSLIVENSKDIEVVCEANSGEEALNIIIKTRNIDLIITDMTMPNMSGIELTKCLKKSHPNLGVLILSMHDDDEYILDALNAGAMGYITKDASKEELIEAINRIFKGKMYYSSSLTDILARQIKQDRNQKESISSSNITDREMEVLQLIVKGLSNK